MSEQPLELVVPCYNPANLWHEDLIANYWKFCESINQDCRLILINDGSTRGVTESEIDQIKASIPHFLYLSYSDNKGKGHALRYGISRVESDFLITTDIDFPYTNESMVALYDELLTHQGLILGTRKTTYYRKVPFFRKVLSLAFRIILKLILKLEVDDTQCGLKGLDKATRQIFLQTKVDGYLFDLEFVRIVSKKNLPIHRVNAVLKPSIEFTNMSPRILMREFSNLLKIVRS